jgi:hypothetical protein
MDLALLLATENAELLSELQCAERLLAKQEPRVPA